MLNFTEAEINDKLLNIITQSELKGYWWKKGTRTYTYDTVTGMDGTLCYSGSSTTNEYIVYYADAYRTEGTQFILINPQTLSVTYNTYTNANVLKGKYYKLNVDEANSIRYVPLTSEVTRSNVSNFSVFMSDTTRYYNLAPSTNFIEYVHAMEINAYPDNDYAVDGYWYYDKVALLDPVNYMDVDKYELLATHANGSTSLYYTVPDLTQYRYFYITMVGVKDNSAVTPTFIPASFFRVVDRMINVSIQSNAYMWVKYINDTQIQMYINYSDTNHPIYFYGMK